MPSSSGSEQARLEIQDASLYFPGSISTETVDETSGRLGGVPVVRDGRGYIRALHGISLTLTAGDRLGIVGHNGSGKSTLLRVMAGIYTPQEGWVHCNRPVSGIFNMSIGFRQEATGYRNIILKGLMAGRSPAEIKQAIAEIEEFTELGSYLRMPLRTYSQGMALRLAFATTTAFTHEVLVMDEWIGAGDARFQEKVVARMNSMLDRASICVIASHSNGLLRRITDRCLWLEDGAIRMLGGTDEVLTAYEDEVSARQLELVDEAKQRLPIPPAHRAFWVANSRPGQGDRLQVTLAWDVERFNVGSVNVYLVDGDDRLVFAGRGTDKRQTGPWVRRGMRFELRAAADEEVLAALVIAE